MYTHFSLLLRFICFDSVDASFLGVHTVLLCPQDYQMFLQKRCLLVLQTGLQGIVKIIVGF